MKLRNKQTGEIAEASVLNFELVVRYDDGRVEKYPLLFDYTNFEYYEEPKEHWCITMYGGITRIKDDEEPIDDLIEVGNYFNSKEDTYDARDKLKAWKRLKDEGFRFMGYNKKRTGLDLDYISITALAPRDKELLALLFGGEE